MLQHKKNECLPNRKEMEAASQRAFSAMAPQLRNSLPYELWTVVSGTKKLALWGGWGDFSVVWFWLFISAFIATFNDWLLSCLSQHIVALLLLLHFYAAIFVFIFLWNDDVFMWPDILYCFLCLFIAALFHIDILYVVYFILFKLAWAPTLVEKRGIKLC